MAKTVNASVLITRDGSTAVQNFPAMGYATFVALQASLTAALASLTSWGTIKVADAAEGKASDHVGGDADLKVELRADFGGGTSEAVVGYTGISAQDADAITAMMTQAISSVVKK